MQPPVAAEHPHLIEQHGDVRSDPYFWLRNRADPAVKAYLQAENDYTAAQMRHTEPLQAQLYAEMRGRIQERDQTYPDEIDHYFYYQRFEAGQQYPVYCRRRGAMSAPEEVLLDVNQLAAGQPYAQVTNVRVSPDHQWLAYGFDNSGDEVYTLFVKELASGELLSEQISNTYYGLAWLNDSRTFVYTVLDAAKRPYRAYRHRLGTEPALDELLYEETDERFSMGVEKCKSQAFVLITLGSSTTSEVWTLAADTPTASPNIVAPRRPGIEYSVAHHSDHFYITTNAAAKNFRVMTAPVAAPDYPHWQEWIPHRPAVLVQATEAYRRHLVVYEREQGLRHLRVINLETGDDRRVALPEPVYALSRQYNPNFASRLVRFAYESLVTPETIYEYDMDDHTLHLRKQTVVNGYDPKEYETKRLWATAADGAQVPVSIVHRKGIRLDGANPTLLRGYGAYGATWDAYFDAKRISLLARGFVFGLAHIRGGSEMGREWYEQGKLRHKMNTFTDFIACAEHLIRTSYTCPEKLVIHGRSAGGLLMGAVANLRPDLFAGVVAGVPFVDVISTMLDSSIPLTAQEYEEWGDPFDPQQYAYMRAYSPYDNIVDRSYPRILATAGFNDPRVQYWEPAKWVARLRTLANNANLVLLKTNFAAGHSGSSGRYDALYEAAFEYAFVLDTVGFQPREP